LLHEAARAASDDETPQGALTIGSLEATAMPRKSPFVISLSYEERSELVRRSRQYTSPYRDVIRAKIVLLASQGLANDIIAARLDTPRQIVSKWRRRFYAERLPGRRLTSRIEFGCGLRIRNGRRLQDPAAVFFSRIWSVPLIEPIYEGQKSAYHKNDSH
jgi:hypothetical protein